jgi:hypothetical protein
MKARKVAHEPLIPGLAKPGDTVLCIRSPNVDIFEHSDLFGDYWVTRLPRVGEVYEVRRNSLLQVGGRIYRGLHLKGVVNADAYVAGEPRGEPFFELQAFALIEVRPR